MKPIRKKTENCAFTPKNLLIQNNIKRDLKQNYEKLRDSICSRQC